MSEEDRAHLSSKAQLSSSDAVEEGREEDTATGASTEEIAILETQVEELLTRETELLDLLDDKVSTISLTK